MVPRLCADSSAQGGVIWIHRRHSPGGRHSSQLQRQSQPCPAPQSGKLWLDWTVPTRAAALGFLRVLQPGYLVEAGARTKHPVRGPCTAISSPQPRDDLQTAITCAFATEWARRQRCPLGTFVTGLSFSTAASYSLRVPSWSHGIREIPSPQLCIHLPLSGAGPYGRGPWAGFAGLPTRWFWGLHDDEGLKPCRDQLPALP